MARLRTPLAILLVALSWTVGGAIRYLLTLQMGLEIMTALGWPRGWLVLRPFAGWLVAGAATAAALRLAPGRLPRPRGWQLALVALIWMLAAPFRWRFGWQRTYYADPLSFSLPGSFFNPHVVAWPIGVILGGLGMALILRRSRLPGTSRLALSGREVLTIALGWLAGQQVYSLAFHAFLGPLLEATLHRQMRGLADETLYSLCVGLIGAAITFWQLGRASGERPAVPDAPARASNPLLARLLRHEVWPSLPKLLLSGGMMVAASVAISTWMWPRMDIRSVLLVRVWPMLPLLPMAGTLLPPMIAATFAALRVASEAHRESIQLLRLTDLTRREIAWAYTVEALARLRPLLVAHLALIPLLIAVALHTSRNPFLMTLPSISPPQMAGALAVAVGLLGLNLLGASLGVWLALGRWDRWLAAAAAPLATLGAALALMVLLLSGVRNMATAWMAQGTGALFFMAAPFVATVELVEGIRREVW